jgi:hypothetical protein
VRWGRRGDRSTLALYGRPYVSLLARLRWGRVELEDLTRHRAGSSKGAGRSDLLSRVWLWCLRTQSARRRLPQLTSSQLGRLEDALRRDRWRRSSSEGEGESVPQIYEGTAPPVTEVLEYRPHEDGYLQLELRRYIRRDGSSRDRGPYWYFQFHEGGKRRKLYLGKTSDPDSTLAAKRA